MSKPRVRWNNDNQVWAVSHEHSTTTLGFATWKQAVSYALTIVDTLSVLEPQRRVIGW